MRKHCEVRRKNPEPPSGRNLACRKAWLQRLQPLPDRSHPTEYMGIFDSRTARALATVLIFVVAAWFVYKVRSTLILVLFSVFFAYLLEPIVLRIERSPMGRNSRALAILETYLICGGILTLLIVHLRSVESSMICVS